MTLFTTELVEAHKSRTISSYDVEDKLGVEESRFGPHILHQSCTLASIERVLLQLSVEMMSRTSDSLEAEEAWSAKPVDATAGYSELRFRHSDLSHPGVAESKKRKNEAAIRMLRRWLADPDQTEYDERVWPIAKAAIEENHHAQRKLFRD